MIFALSNGMVKLHGADNSQRMTVLNVFTISMPGKFLHKFKVWLSTGPDKPIADVVTFDI